MKTHISNDIAKFGILLLLLVFAHGKAQAQPGSLDLSFNPVLGLGDPEVDPPPIITKAVVLDDRTILLNGRFYGVNESPIRHLARIHPDGSLDTNFNTGTGFFFTENSPNFTPLLDSGTTVLSSGKILVTGRFDRFDDVPVPTVIRLHQNGSRDTTFDIGSGPENREFGPFSNIVQSMVELGDGSILIGGTFDTWDGVAQNYLVKIGPDGERDMSFNPQFTFLDADGFPGSGVVQPIRVQADGKLIVAGQFNQVDGLLRANVVRLHPNGAVDATFDPGDGATGFGDEIEINDAAILEDGKILLAGSFTAFDGFPRGGVVLLNANGSVNTDFAPEFLIQEEDFIEPGYVSGIIPQPGGRWLFTGIFNSVKGHARSNIVRLNATGEVDPSFETQVGASEIIPNGIVLNGAIQNDGKILIWGFFGAVNGESRIGLTRLNPDTTRIESIRPNPEGTMVLTILKGTDADLSVQAAPRIGEWSEIGVLKGPSGTMQFTDTNAVNFRTRFYRTEQP